MEFAFFTENELKCPCCGEMKMDIRFMDRMSGLRICVNEPMPVTSGYRCKKHNKAVGGRPNSAHLIGRAVDINIYHNKVYKMLSHLLTYGLTGVGFKQTGAANHRIIHLDDLEQTENRMRPTVWTY